MYSKLFQSMYDGSLATRGPWEALVTFQNLLVLADKHGIVDCTPLAISRRTTLPLEIVNKGLAALSEPDPDSRRPDHEGKRIIPLDPDRAWGWQIVNFAAYKAIRSSEERAAYQRQYMRDWRAGKRRKAHKGNGAGESPPPDESPEICKLPLVGGAEFTVRQSLIEELAPLYPLVDVPSSLGLMRGWLIGNPERKKTARGVKRFITTWLAREQSEYAAQDSAR